MLTIGPMRAQRKKRKRAKKYRNNDLPGLLEIKELWNSCVVPMFRDYTAVSDDPWELAGAVEQAQWLWDRYFPDIKHTVQPQNDPVFFLVWFHVSFLCHAIASNIIKLQQQVYTWRGGFASRAEKAVENYFDQRPCFDNPKFRAAYISWAVREPTEQLDDHGHKVVIPPAECPYMWVRFEDDNPDDVVCMFTFRDQ